MIGSNIRCDTNQIPSLNEMVKTISAFTCFLSTTKQVVTTHVSTTPTSITNPRTGSHGEHPQQPVFSLEKSSRRSTNTQWLLWRWANYFQRAWSWSWNAAYACGYLVPWCSPLGVRALFSSQPFYADLELSQVRQCCRYFSFSERATFRESNHAVIICSGTVVFHLDRQ